jgi:hypothetical protein
MHEPPSGDPTTTERFSDQLGRDYRPDPTGRHRFRALVHGRWSEWVSDGPGRPPRSDPDGADSPRDRR